MLPNDVRELLGFGFLSSMVLHGLGHIINLILFEGVVHELEIVFWSYLSVDEYADIQGTCFDGIPLADDHQVHTSHDGLKGSRIDLSKRRAQTGQNPSKQFDGSLGDGQIFIITESGGN